jgi:two-component system, LytTR family, response regulator
MFTVLIVDDEPLASRELESLMRARSDIGRVLLAEDGLKALEVLEQERVDVVFLDMQMPEMTGLELLEACQARNIPMPAVIFATAYEHYALKAFEHHAADYVLKPFSADRVTEALNVAIRRSQAERVSKLVDVFSDFQKVSQQRPKRIAIKVQGRILFINPAEVVFVQAEGNYVLLQTVNGTYLLRESMSQVEQKLEPYGFIRIHRSVIVNSAFVKEYQPCYTGEYSLKLLNGKEFTVTRTYKKNLRQLAGDVIGLESPSVED